MANPPYLQSSEFKRTTGNAANKAIKVFFKWLEVAIVGLINFIKSMIKMAIGQQ